MSGDKRMGLAQGINGVPDRRGYIYGLAVRKGEHVEVDVLAPDGSTFHVEGIGWAGPDGIHARAQKIIDEREAA